jgi:tetratricopeptide (TPR) repeat protein
MLSLSLVLFATGLAFQNTSMQPATPASAQGRREITPLERADIYMARKMYREAIEIYKTVPASALVMNKIGIAYHQLSELQSAESYYRRAIKIDPTYSEAINNLGTIYYARKSYRRAISEYKKVLRLKPDSASTWANIANAYFERKQFELSTEAVQKALELDPNVFESRGAGGSVVQERSIGDRARYHYYLAKSYAKAGRNADAIVYIRRALEEGFKERKKFEEEPEFAGLKDDPEFKQLMTMELKTL